MWPNRRLAWSSHQYFLEDVQPEIKPFDPASRPLPQFYFTVKASDSVQSCAFILVAQLPQAAPAAVAVNTGEIRMLTANPRSLSISSLSQYSLAVGCPSAKGGARRTVFGDVT